MLGQQVPAVSGANQDWEQCFLHLCTAISEINITCLKSYKLNELINMQFRSLFVNPFEYFFRKLEWI